MATGPSLPDPLSRPETYDIFGQRRQPTSSSADAPKRDESDDNTRDSVGSAGFASPREPTMQAEGRGSPAEGSVPNDPVVYAE